MGVLLCVSIIFIFPHDSAVYGYERVMAEVDELRPMLVDITQGKVPSELHRKFLEGTRKEQSQLKVAPKAGRLTKWSTSKVSIVIGSIYFVCCIKRPIRLRVVHIILCVSQAEDGSGWDLEFLAFRI